LIEHVIQTINLETKTDLVEQRRKNEAHS